MFVSINKVPRIASPVLVIHGTEDEVIDFTHGLAIYERCPRALAPLWIEGAGHNDIELYSQYLDRLKRLVNVDLTPRSPQTDFLWWTVYSGPCKFLVLKFDIPPLSVIVVPSNLIQQYCLTSRDGWISGQILLSGN